MDAAAIMDQLGWTIDCRDWDGVVADLADTVELDYSEVFGGEAAPIAGIDLAAQWKQRLGALDATQHVIPACSRHPSRTTSSG